MADAILSRSFLNFCEHSKFLRESCFKFHGGSRQGLVVFIILFHRLENITHLYESHLGTFRKKKHCKDIRVPSDRNWKQVQQTLGIDSAVSFLLTSETSLVMFCVCFFPVYFHCQLASCRPCLTCSVQYSFFLSSCFFYFFLWSSTSGRAGQK